MSFEVEFIERLDEVLEGLEAATAKVWNLNQFTSKNGPSTQENLKRQKDLRDLGTILGPLTRELAKMIAEEVEAGQ